MIFTIIKVENFEMCLSETVERNLFFFNTCIYSTCISLNEEGKILLWKLSRARGEQYLLLPSRFRDPPPPPVFNEIN